MSGDTVTAFGQQWRRVWKDDGPQDMLSRLVRARAEWLRLFGEEMPLHSDAINADVIGDDDIIHLHHGDRAVSMDAAWRYSIWVPAVGPCNCIVGCGGAP